MVEIRDRHARRFGASVAGDVGGRARDHSHDGMSYVRGQDDGFTDGADPNGRDELAGGGHDQGVEVARTALGRRQIVDEVATLHQARSDVLCCGIDIGSRRRTRCIPRLFGCLEP